ncbi:MAG: hypothetical protein EHM93_16850 [Bacteroidales bacterium]|nr:MAG: hypothetical protein EHM93_16850 [Bacteroidales bacterium]
MKKRIAIKSLVVLCVVLLSVGAAAQSRVKETKKFSDKIFYGGSIGLLFGTVTRVDILPQVGVWVIPQWAVGVGGRYTYRKGSYGIVGEDTKPLKSHIWGVSGFTQIVPFPDLDKAFRIGIHGGLIFQAEWEGLYLDKRIGNLSTTDENGKGWVHLVLVGVGYRFPLGDKAALNLLAMWNLTDSPYSPYSSNPMLRISINF